MLDRAILGSKAEDAPSTAPGWTLPGFREGMPTRILLADDEVVLRQTLKAFLERQGFTVVAETSDGREAVELARRHRPNVAVVEVSLQHLNGLSAAREIIRARPSVGVILLTRILDDQYVREALRHGVRGFVVKSQPVADLLQAIREVSRGGVYVGPSASSAIVQVGRAARTRVQESLSPREREVLVLLVQGRTTKQIAGLLNIRPKTADFHRTRLMKKLNIHDVAGLVRYAIRHGFATP